MARIPVIGVVSAGQGTSNVDTAEHGVFVPMTLAQIGGVGWVVDGDSMMPALDPGDVALFREHRQPRRGYPFLLQRDAEFRVKIIDYDAVSGKWFLKSLNPAYPSEPMDDHVILGYLIGWYKVRGSRETTDSDPGGLKLD